MELTHVNNRPKTKTGIKCNTSLFRRMILTGGSFKTSGGLGNTVEETTVVLG